MYRVKEIFPTLQGEGHHAGTPAVFVRFAGCNMWSGRQATRERDAERNSAECARWCDTDFVGGESLTAGQVAEEVLAAAARAEMAPGPPLVVFTGGEPLLQLDEGLLSALRDSLPGGRGVLAIETNGRTPLSPSVRDALDWICVSPKGTPDQLVVREGDELKVVFPAYRPEDFEASAATLDFQYWYLQAEATPIGEDGRYLAVGQSSLQPDLMQAAVEYCLSHPQWKFSLQIHKVLELP